MGLVLFYVKLELLSISLLPAGQGSRNGMECSFLELNLDVALWSVLVKFVRKISIVVTKALALNCNLTVFLFVCNLDNYFNFCVLLSIYCFLKIEGWISTRATRSNAEPVLYPSETSFNSCRCIIKLHKKNCLVWVYSEKYAF